MKKILLFLLLILLSLSVFFHEKITHNINYLLQSPCERPIEYQIGSIDPEFHISEADLLAHIQEGTKVWHQSKYDKLFAYNSEGSLKINLVYDGRQSLRSKINELGDILQTDKSTLDQEKELYQNLVAEYQQKFDTFNEKVSYWNSRGGAPQKTYAQLKKEQQELQSEADHLNTLANKLDFSATEYNLQVSELQETVEDYNENIEKRPEEGTYDPNENKIDIYFYTDEEELIHTIAHEFGHALSIEHLENNPQAIMYPYTSKTTDLTPDDTTLLNTICEQQTYKVLIQDLVARVKNKI